MKVNTLYHEGRLSERDRKISLGLINREIRKSGFEQCTPTAYKCTPTADTPIEVNYNVKEKSL